MGQVGLILKCIEWNKGLEDGKGRKDPSCKEL